MDYERPGNGWRFQFGGLNLRSSADSLPPNKYASALNVRAYSASSIQTRPGYIPYATAGNNAITDIASYSALGTDDNPQFLLRDNAGSIWLNNNSVFVGPGNSQSGGARMLPFRPNKSPQSWMYVADGRNNVKISAPVNNNTTNAKVGIPEPAGPCNAIPQPLGFTLFANSTVAASWTAGGTGANVTAVGGNTSNASFSVVDPIAGNRTSVFLTSYDSTEGFQVGGLVYFGGSPYIIQDIIGGIGTLAVQGIRYDSGTSGNCVVVPTQNPAFSDLTQSVSNLRRGQIVQIGNENVFVRMVTNGKNGSVCFDTSTATNHVVGAGMYGFTTLIVDGPLAGNNFVATKGVQATGSSGTATISLPLATSPFGSNLGVTGALPQAEDYVHFTLQVSDPTLVQNIQLAFNVDAHDTTYTKNYYYYSISPNALSTALLGPGNNNYSVTDAAIAGVNSTTDVQIPISSLSRVGGDLSRGLANCNGVQMSVNVAASANNSTLTFGLYNLWVGGGGQPDIGSTGIPYRYRAVPFSTATGATGNPSPDMHYGVRPRRQPVVVTMPAIPDAQVDTWLVFRYGGSVTTWRFVGSVPADGTSTFTDNFFDDTALAGAEMQTDNLEPWPTVDLPFAADGTITATGTRLVVQSSSFPASIARWLPGTLIALANTNIYTLYQRPTLIDSTHYLFLIQECAGTVSGTGFVVNEPQVANQPAAGQWGPDDNGTIFAVGDTLRPGVVYISKPYNPDSARDQIELSQPSEPLMNGEIISGVSYVASTNRWWGLYPSFAGSSAYAQKTIEVGRGVAARFGVCSDGSKIYFWAKDCIAAHSGGTYADLTSADLYSLFPHDGIPGADKVRNGVTYYAPDYSKTSSFRLSVIQRFLYADYLDTGGFTRTLVCDLSTGAWVEDSYANNITCHIGNPQQSGPLIGGSTPAYPLCIMGDFTGKAWRMMPNVGDNGNSITASLATFEWDGGDARSQPQWGDMYLDCLPINGVTVTPVSIGANLSNSTVAANNNRQFTPIPISANGQFKAKFMGMQLDWIDQSNNTRTNSTVLHAWQSSKISQPEITTNRVTDWFDLGGAAYVRGFRMTADTFGANKTIAFRNGDTGAFVVLAANNNTNLTINFNGEQQQGFAFTPPFVAHKVRIEPTDATQWRLFQVDNWIRDPYPELTPEYSPIMELGGAGEKYFRAVDIIGDSNNANVSFQITYDGGQNGPTLGPVAFNGKQTQSFSFTPFIAHDVQLVPQNSCRVWTAESKWTFDPWPDLTKEVSPWMNLGTPGAKYLRGAVIPVDSNGANCTLSLVSSDGGNNVTIGPFNTAAGKMTDVPWAFTVPLIGHEFQLQPQNNCRVWYDQIRWDFDPWPELINEATGWLKPFPDGGAAFLQGVLLPLESNAATLNLKLLYEDGSNENLTPILTPVANIKTPVPFSLPTPKVCHAVQIVPNAPCRIWLNEIQWLAQRTAELATTWISQPTSHQLQGYHHIMRIEAVWSSTTPVTLSLTVFDGLSPSPITLPSTGGVKQRAMFVLSPNKGQQYTYAATSSAPFQLYLNDFCIWVKQWGSPGPYIPYRLLGGEFGERAAI